MWFFNYNKAVMAYQPWLKGLQPNATELAIQISGRDLGRGSHRRLPSKPGIERQLTRTCRS